MNPLYFAEAVCANCENGLTFPLEIAFATPCGLDVYVFKIQSPPPHCLLTLQDMFNTRSRLGNRDRFYNNETLPSPPPPRAPTFEFTLSWDSWLSQLLDWLHHQGNPGLYVRGRYQMWFFRSLCGYPYVRQMKMNSGPRVFGLRRHAHRVNRTLRAYPCPGIEVQSMAFYSGLGLNGRC